MGDRIVLRVSNAEFALKYTHQDIGWNLLDGTIRGANFLLLRSAVQYTIKGCLSYIRVTCPVAHGIAAIRINTTRSALLGCLRPMKLPDRPALNTVKYPECREASRENSRSPSYPFLGITLMSKHSRASGLSSSGRMAHASRPWGLGCGLRCMKSCGSSLRLWLICPFIATRSASISTSASLASSTHGAAIRSQSRSP